MKTTIHIIMVSVLSAGVTATPGLARQSPLSDESIDALVGGWSGAITGETVSQDVLWRFEPADPGQLMGFMGPTAMGPASIPGPSEYPAVRRFTGTVSDEGVEGNWFEGVEAPIAMRKAASGP